ncbi:hypothetical protein D3C76_427860 [compost metagenome]
MITPDQTSLSHKTVLHSGCEVLPLSQRVGYPDNAYPALMHDRNRHPHFGMHAKLEAPSLLIHSQKDKQISFDQAIWHYCK